eukprot:4630941-Karenia_brevis.AAC.1
MAQLGTWSMMTMLFSKEAMQTTMFGTRPGETGEKRERAIDAIGMSKARPKKKFRLWASEIEKRSGADPTLEIE